MLIGQRPLWQLLTCILFYGLVAASTVSAEDRHQWGQRHSRNMVSNEAGLPETFDLASDKNVKWAVPLGTQTWSTPVVAKGRVLIGTNNGRPRDARHKGDRGVLLCLNEKDGRLCWQLVVPKIKGDPYKDWPRVGIVSPATVEGDRVYIVSNRGEAMCLDLYGQQDGNDGPYWEEGQHVVAQGSEPAKVTELDADIIWLYDVPAELGIYPHDSAHSSILIQGDFLYINTSSGLNSSHTRVRVPDKPSLIVLDKGTGRLVAQEDEGIGPRIFHSTWSSPASAEVNGKTLVFFCGGNGVCYAFDALESAPADGTTVDLQRVWSFDCDPTAPKQNIHQYIRNQQISPSNIKSMPVFHRNRVYVTVGGDIWWGKNKAWLKCIDATKDGDITYEGRVWSYPVERHCCSTPSVYEGLVFVADCGGNVHCVDAETGKAYWTHKTDGEIWGSTLVADGKVYVGTRRGGFWVFAASADKNVISSIKLDSPIASTPVAANGVLYIATMKTLYAFKDRQ